MLDLAVAIIGSGEISYNAATELLDDYLTEDSWVLIPSYINSKGLKIVHDWLNEANVPYERVNRKEIIIDLVNEPAKKTILIVIGTEGMDAEIAKAFEHHIEVLDLTAGLYPLSSDAELALHGPVSAVETRSQEVGTSALPNPQTSLIDYADASGNNDRVRELERRIEQLEAMMHPRINSSETGWEPDIPLPVSAKKEAAITGTEDIAELTAAYYKSKRGKLRKAGRSKARPGEELVHLTQEEIDNLE